jgi:putative hemolysin
MGTTETAAATAYPPNPEALPTLRERAGRYVLQFARQPEDLDRITKLRFEVFNLEIGEGLDSSYERCRDIDAFDACCHHLMVSRADTAEVVGTYRLQTHAMAGSGRGYYSSDEFDLTPMASRLPEAIELGRACIAREHRNQRVLFLLWRGLARYVMENSGRYFFGCCSLTGQNVEHAWAVHAHLHRGGYLHPTLEVPTTAPYRCPEAPSPVISDVSVPTLMQLYLDYGARIISPPALDRRFNTIDFLALFDLADVDARVRRMFFD